MSSIEKLLELMKTLRDPQAGCPWDRAQSYQSIVPYTIEEAYEVAEAVAENDLSALEDELGDLLFQVVFLSRIAEEEGAFSFDDVANGIHEKLVRRHPHVFGGRDDAVAGDGWEQIKRAERAQKSPRAGVLGDVPLALPALKRASKLGKRAAAVGFDWPDASGVRAKIDEELAELDAAASEADKAALVEELGDVLFSTANLARHYGFDAEQALAEANRKFIRRFRGMEKAAQAAGRSLEALDPDDLESLWEAQKGGS